MFTLHQGNHFQDVFVSSIWLPSSKIAQKRISGPLARDGHWRNACDLLSQGHHCRIDTSEIARSSAMNACKEVSLFGVWFLTFWLLGVALRFATEMGG